MVSESSEYTFEVTSEEAGERLDALVVRHVPAVHRRRARDLFIDGCVRCDGRRAAKGDRAQLGARVSVTLEEPEAPFEADASDLAVCAESEHWLVLSKPSGIPTVGLRGSVRGTLAGSLLVRFPELASVGPPLEAGLVQRLDTQTSGLVVAARSAVAHTRLRTAIRNEEFDKHYLAVVPDHELPGSGIIDWPLAPHPRDRRRVMVVTGASRASGARAATTHFSVVKRGSRWALLLVKAARAYRHQVRAHLAKMGYPIAGDTLYGREATEELPHRHALHASYIAWAGADGIPGFAVTDPLPEELARLLEE